LAQVMIMGFS
jgi:hypothetical protein